MNKLRILHLISSIGPASGGLGPVAMGFLREQKLLGYNPIIWTMDSASVAYETARANGLNPDDIKTYNCFGPRKLRYSPSMLRQALAIDGSTFDILHQHSLWLAVSHLTNRWRKKFSRPTLVSPHGTLEDYAIRRSAWKKKIALFAYEMSNLQNATCLHATAYSEANSIRNFGLKNPIAVIPNGIPEEWLLRKGDANEFRSRFSIAPDTRILLFLSRINPKKGLPMLFSAISQLENEFKGWCLVVAGFEDVPGYQKELEQLAKQLRLSKKIIFVGPLFGRDKEDVFAAADLFVLPTHSENFGIVVTEALASGIPVVTTHGAPWEELQIYNCGWWVEIGVQGIYDALKDAIGRTEQELVEMGARGRQLVESKYTWPQAAKMTMKLYNWMLGRCDKPGFVI